MLTTQQPPKSPVKFEAESNTEKLSLPPSVQPKSASLQPPIQDHFAQRLNTLISANEPKLLDQSLAQQCSNADDKLHILEWDAAECKAVFKDVVRVYTESKSVEHANIMKESRQHPISKLRNGPQTTLCTQVATTQG